MTTASVLALTCNIAPSMACTAISSNTTISSSTGCVSWSGGNLSVTNTGAISASGATALVISGSSVGTLTNSGTISSGSAGIFNTGTVGTLSNSGTITGVNFGIFNTGTVSTLTNSGNISDGGIVNSGSIGALSNTGTISGGGWTGILNNTGNTIGTLSNSGTITGGAGNAGIVNNGSIGTLTNDGTISGTIGILNNTGGSIVTLSNSGTISGDASYAGIINSGNIGTLSNNGSISGGNNGILNTGTISALSNSGTIQAPTAIFNDTTGTLGPIVNSGLIAGNITNQSSQTLTIDGGSGTTFGTLTGASGAIGSANQGTITNTASNLVFASGNLLLNDAINVGSNTVVNSGATLKVVNPVAITGAYQQTGGGLVVQAASASNYGYLDVSRNATVANATIVITGTGLVRDTTFTIVRAGGTGSYGGDTVSIIGTNGLTATLETIGDDLVVSLRGSLSGNSNFTAIGLATGGVAAQLGPVLDRINGSSAASAVAFQHAVLVPLILLPKSQQGLAMKQLAPAYNTSQLVLASAATVQETVEQHQQTTMRYDPKPGEAAPSDTGDSALWAHLLGSGARRDSGAGFDGYRSNDAGLIAGVDHLFTPQILGGVAVSGLRGSLGGSDGAGGQSATMDSYQLTLYGTYRHGRAFIDGQLGAGWNHFGQNRAIPFLAETASASFDGRQYLAHALAGYDVPLGGPGDMVITPLIGLGWLRVRNGAYSETGAGAADLLVKGQTLNGLTQELGVKTAWSFATGFGQLVPELTAKWVHDYTHDAVASSGVIGGETFAVAVPRGTADGARIATAATLKRNERLSFGAEYNGELRAGYRSHTGAIKAHWQF